MVFLVGCVEARGQSHVTFSIDLHSKKHLFMPLFVCSFICFSNSVSRWTWHFWVRLGCPAGNVLGYFCSPMASVSSHGCWDLSSGVQAWVASSPHRALSSHPLAICFLSCMVTVKIQCTYSEFMKVAHEYNPCEVYMCLCTHMYGVLQKDHFPVHIFIVLLLQICI